ncbi:MAG: SDR family NAD(P)-dependent oxidoreductase [Chloroflexi bacterium]|nr:SDR family NAD(P)-dependent oxidoreductase [Chloroflexota bacterium]
MYVIKRFEDKVVAVTGGAKGIGKACCLRFAEEGARVAVLDLALEDAVATAAECEKLSGQPALALHCNVADAASVDAAFKAVADAWPQGLDVVVASAGIYSGQPLVEVPLSEWQKVIDVDLTGVFLTNQAAAKIMMKQTCRRSPSGGGGSIINISSMAGKTSWSASAQYSAAKSGVIGLTRSVAMDMAPYGVTVNAVCPGNTMTEMVQGVAATIAARDGLSAGEWLRLRAQDCPLKRFAESEEIAGVVAFLASRDAGYINGQAIEVDGGMVMS